MFKDYTGYVIKSEINYNGINYNISEDLIHVLHTASIPIVINKLLPDYTLNFKIYGSKNINVNDNEYDCPCEDITDHHYDFKFTIVGHVTNMSSLASGIELKLIKSSSNKFSITKFRLLSGRYEALINYLFLLSIGHDMKLGKKLDNINFIDKMLKFNLLRGYVEKYKIYNVKDLKSKYL